MAKRRRLNGSTKTPRELDVVEVVVDGAEVPRGTQGTVVDDSGTGTYLIEIVDQDGQTSAVPTVTRDQIHVVWRSAARLREVATNAQSGG